MNNTLAVKATSLVNVIYTTRELTDTDIKLARSIFENYKKQGFIMEGSFDDDTWLLYDEYSKTTIDFTINELCYRKYYEQLFGISYNRFGICFRTFCVGLFGKRVTSSMQNFANDIRKIINTDPAEIGKIGSRLCNPGLCSDMLQLLLADSENSTLPEALDNIEQDNYSRKSIKRELWQIDTYIVFDQIMDEFWKDDMDDETRFFYYPLYLWWKITAILPLRPREFIVTPRDCLEHREDGYYLTIRRNNLKGKDKKIYYTLREAYFTNTYAITDELGKEIEKYLSFTEAFDSTDINTLFITNPHYKKWNQSKRSNSRFLTYVNMRTILRYFYKEIIMEKYGYSIVNAKDAGHLEDNEIGMLHLGDARHLAISNLISEGGTPTLAMFLAGHDNVEMSFHYASNITYLIECRTYIQYMKLKADSGSYKISKADKVYSARSSTPLPDGGVCYSDKYPRHDFSDCMHVVSDEGEIGKCGAHCPFYRRNGHHYEDDAEHKKRINEVCQRLSEMVRAVRNGKGAIEDIGEAMLKVRSESLSYANFCRERQQLKGE